MSNLKIAVNQGFMSFNSMHSTSDDELLKQLQQQHEPALNDLYVRYSTKVFNTAISYLQNQEDAEEVLQDVFVSLFEDARKFNFNSSVSTWIYRITVNKSLDYLRKRNSKKRTGIFVAMYKRETNEVIHHPTDFVHPGNTLENKEDAKLLFRAIDRLPETQKTAIILTKIEGLKQQECAEIMGITRKAVESLIQRAMVNLKKELTNQFPERGNIT